MIERITRARKRKAESFLGQIYFPRQHRRSQLESPLRPAYRAIEGEIVILVSAIATPVTLLVLQSLEGGRRDSKGRRGGEIKESGMSNKTTCPRDHARA